MTPIAGEVRYGTPAGRWVILATVLGSGIAFLDSTVVNVALPALARDLHADLAGLQWTVDAYLLTLSSLLLLGGSLGDLYGRRRVFVIGLVAFTVASLACGLAPNVGTLVVARALQGVGGALLVPGSLSLLSSSFSADNRSRAVGAWSGLAGVTSAAGPIVGGWLVGSVSWRLVFLINLPLAGLCLWVTLRHVPESGDPGASRKPDFAGAALATAGLGGITYALIEGAAHRALTVDVVAAGVVGLVSCLAFPFVEARVKSPLVPLEIFRSRQFSAANVTTLIVYAGLGVAFFMLVYELQRALGFSPLAAGTSMLPVTALLLLLSARAGQLSQRIGPRLPMTFGPWLMAAGLVIFSRLHPGSGYLDGVLPGALVFGLGLAGTVAPLTSAVMASVDERHLGVGSGVNNAVARAGGLLAVALLPLLVGLDVRASPAALSQAVGRAMLLGAALCFAGGVVSFLFVRKAAPAEATPPPSPDHGCSAPRPGRMATEIGKAAGQKA